MPWGCFCLFSSDWIQPIHADKGSVVQVQFRLNPGSQVWALYWSFDSFSSSPCGFFWHLKSFFFVFLFFCNTQLHVSFYWHGHPGVTWLLPRGAGPFRSDACPAAVAESCPPGQQKVIFKWLIFTTRLRRSDLHKSPLVWRVSFTCPFTRLYPRGRQRRTRLGDEAHAEKTHDNRSGEVNYSTLLNTRYYILV